MASWWRHSIFPAATAAAGSIPSWPASPSSLAPIRSTCVTAQATHAPRPSPSRPTPCAASSTTRRRSWIDHPCLRLRRARRVSRKERILLPRSCILILLCLAAPVHAAEPWATYRGNSERTGNTDGKAGPEQPKVLWKLVGKDHYIAAPVPHGSRLFVSGLGAFNVSNFSCLGADAKLAPKPLWTKTTPYLKLPTVSSPSLFKGKLVFGDGMHQTDGATLHCLEVDQGLPLWQLPLPGTLVHLEG